MGSPTSAIAGGGVGPHDVGYLPDMVDETSKSIAEQSYVTVLDFLARLI